MKNQNNTSKIDKNLLKNSMIAIVLVIILASSVWGIIYLVNKGKKEYEIEEISEFKYYTIRVNDKVGVIDINGNEIIKPEYNGIKIPNPQKPVFICTYDYNYETEEYNTKILNDKNEEIFKNYEEVDCIALKKLVMEVPYEKSVLTYKKDGKYGLIDFSGKIVSKPIYDEIQSFSYKEGELLVKKEEKYGVINIKGTVLLEIKYDEINGDGYYSANSKYRKDGYIVSTKTEDGYRYGYIDFSGKQLLKMEYNEIYRLNNIENDEEIYLVAEKNGQAGLLKNDRQILDHQYQDIEYVKYDNQNKLLILEKNRKYGVSMLNGNAVLPIDYTNINIEGIYIKAEKENQSFIYDMNGNKQTNPSYQNIIKTENEDYRITVDNNGKYGLINKDGKIVVTNKYYYLEYLFDEYLIAVGEEGKAGIINSRDDIIVPITYGVIQKVDDCKLIEAIETNKNVLEIYNSTMKQIASMKNAKLDTEKDYIKIYSNTETLYIGFDEKEKKALELFPNNELYAIKEGKKWGFVDKQGNIKIECKYDKVTELNKYGFAGIRLGDKWGVINKEGQIVIEPIYEIDENAGEPDFIGKYYRVIAGYGDTYYTDYIEDEE